MARARNNIVDPTTILTDNQILTEEITFRELTLAIADEISVLEWLARHRLIRNTTTCTICNGPASLNMYAQGVDKFRWRCNAHNFTLSGRRGSFFTQSHLPLKDLISFIFMWCFDMPQQYIQFELKMSDTNFHTIVDWSNFLRDVCEEYLQRNPQQIGGFDANGMPLTVEIDETKYFHRKYHRGQWREGHWVFGGIERETGRCFMIEVPDRRAVTLEPLIRQWILPGSHIVSDGWAAYANINAIGGGIYTHDVIIHERHFVDPTDDDIHTQNIENCWMRAKRKLKRQFGTSRHLFPSYLTEFVFRNRFQKRKSLFGPFLLVVSSIYRV